MKNKKVNILIFVITIFITTFIGCNSSLDGSKVVGTYKHVLSRNMGGFNIVASSNLTITKIGTGNYVYNMSVTIIDEMYGGVPKTQNTSGSLNREIIENNEWKFVGGDLGDRDAYIKVPKNGWTSPPNIITVFFAPGRGDNMNFIRN